MWLMDFLYQPYGRFTGGTTRCAHTCAQRIIVGTNDRTGSSSTEESLDVEYQERQEPQAGRDAGGQGWRSGIVDP